jgi:hypothetical protein
MRPIAAIGWEDKASTADTEMKTLSPCHLNLTQPDAMFVTRYQVVYCTAGHTILARIESEISSLTIYIRK